MKRRKKKNSIGHFPDKKKLQRIRDKFSDLDFKGGNIDLPQNATEVDRVKYQLCQLIARYKRESGLLQKDIAAEIGVDDSRISDILRGKIESFSLDRLIEYAKKIHPNLRVEIIAA